MEQIINGVDVSGCEELSKEKENFCRDNDYYCSLFPDCYYKQLRRKEGEYEELKRWKEDVADKFVRTCNCKYLDHRRNYCEYYKAECVAINQCLYVNQDKVEKLNQALDKIAENCRNALFGYDQEKYLNSILQIIKESI